MIRSICYFKTRGERRATKGNKRRKQSTTKGGATNSKVGGQNLCVRSEQKLFSVDSPLLA